MYLDIYFVTLVLFTDFSIPHHLAWLVCVHSRLRCMELYMGWGKVRRGGDRRFQEQWREGQLREGVSAVFQDS